MQRLLSSAVTYRCLFLGSSATMQPKGYQTLPRTLGGMIDQVLCKHTFDNADLVCCAAELGAQSEALGLGG